LVASSIAGPNNVRVSSKEAAHLGEGPAAGARANVIISDEEKARGQAAGPGIAEAFVYKNDEYIGNFTLTGERFNWAATTSSVVTNSLGDPRPNPIGRFIADDMTLGGGWTAGTPISSFAAWANRSGSDQTRLIGDGSTTVTLELWDGDPLNEVDSVAVGYASAPIAGAACTFTLPNSLAFEGPGSILKCNLAVPVVPPNDSVWMVMRSASCRVFWPLVLVQPKVGSNEFDVAEYGWDTDAGTITDGTCCNPGNPLCGPSQGAGQFCPGDGTNAGGRCADDDAEDVSFFSFGGPCIGDDATDSCANYWAQIYSPANVTISLVPVEGGGSIGIVGNEIIYAAGGGNAELEVRISDWDPANSGVQLKAWQAQLTSSGFTSALAGTLTFTSHPCTTDADCIAILGGNCALFGNPCTSDANCNVGLAETCNLASPICGNYGGGGHGVPAPQPTVCLPAYINKFRADYVFKNIPGGDLDVVDRSTPNMRWASAGTSSAQNDPAVFPPGGLYAGTLLLDVSSDASGTFTVPLDPPPNSVLVDQNSLFLPLIGTNPALLTIQVGQCSICRFRSPSSAFRTRSPLLSAPPSAECSTRRSPAPIRAAAAIIRSAPTAMPARSTVAWPRRARTRRSPFRPGRAATRRRAMTSTAAAPSPRRMTATSARSTPAPTAGRAAFRSMTRPAPTAMPAAARCSAASRVATVAPASPPTSTVRPARPIRTASI
jgi:hypothetical protein